MQFVKGSIKYADSNFWDVNPLVKFIQPFNELYNIDKGKEISSKYMWCIYFICDPNEKENIFYRVLDKETMLKETFFPEVDWTNEIYLKCKEAYPYECLTSIGKALKDKKEWLLKRERFLTSQDYNLDNSIELDKMASQSKKIWDDFRITEEEFQIESGKIIVKGGRQLSKTERKEI